MLLPPSDRVLVTGSTGLLGPYLADAAGTRATVLRAARSGGDVHGDLSSWCTANDVVRTAAPDIVLHAAAWTDVDGCEKNPDEAARANVVAVENIVSAMDRFAPDALLVYISTDQVYPDAPGPHREHGVGPVNEYGRTKLAGEEATRKHPRSLVLRVNFFGRARTPHRRSLSDWMTTELAARRVITGFDDVLFSPLHVTTLADVVVEAAGARLTGTFNVGSNQGFSKHCFAVAIAHHLELDTGLVHAARSTAAPGRAPRPSDLRMDVQNIENALGHSMPTLASEVQKL